MFDCSICHEKFGSKNIGCFSEWNLGLHFLSLFHEHMHWYTYLSIFLSCNQCECHFLQFNNFDNEFWVKENRMFPWNLGTFKWLVSIALKLKPFQAIFVMTWRIQNCNTRLEMWTPVYFPTLENSEISDLFFSNKYFFCILHMALEKKNRILSNSTQLKMFP